MKKHSRRLLPLGVLLAFALAAGACGDDGDEPSASPATKAEPSAEEPVAEPTEPAETDATAEPSETAEPDETAETGETAEPDEPTEPAEAAASELTSEPVTLRVLMEAGGGANDLLANLGDEFSRQYPNVTFEYQRDSFNNLLINGPRLLASDDPPDVILMPQIADPATEGLILGLDPYFEQFGWDAWSASQLAQNRVNDDGIRGLGTLYGVGAGYSITGVYYNKELAEQVGMDAPPATLDEFEALMARAKEAGILPIISLSPATFAHNAIHNQYVDPADTAAFVFLAPGATIDTPAAVAAAERLQHWANGGYFNDDVNSLDYVSMMSRFIDGEALFMFNGSWEGANLDESMGDNAGFFVVPPLTAGNPPVAMGASGTIVIPAGADHPDVAAFFFDWIHTDPAARQEVADTTGMSPGGPPGLPLPQSDPGSIVELLQGQAAYLAAEGVIVDYLGNATSGFFSSTLVPEVQRLVGGQTEPESFVRALQEGYEASIDR